MSVSRDPHIVTCDGAGCACAARLPVALRSLLIRSDGEARGGDGTAAAITGWLFVTAQGLPSRHYCPLCTPHYLRGLLPELPREQDPGALTPESERKGFHGC